MAAIDEAGRIPLETTESAYPSRGYAGYVVGVLLLVNTFSLMDRQILNLLVGPIRRDLAISDTGMSLLTGFSFAVFYTFFGLPLGRIADGHSRRGLIAAGFVMWSLFTAGCGFARNFAQMFLMRTGVGIGEASLAPAAWSLIADYFPPERRATAQSVYASGVYVGAGVAYLLGGIVIAYASIHPDYVLPLIGTVRSWQLVFFAIGLPGVVSALLLFTVIEPERRGAGAKHAVPFKQVLAYYKDNRATLACHHGGVALNYVAAYGAAAWIPSFFIRHHHWTAAQFGAVFGPEVAICGILGMIFGGWLADKLAEGGYRDASMRVIVLSVLLFLPFGIAYLLVPSAIVAIVLLAPTLCFSAMPLGVMGTALMEVMPARMRGQAASIMLFVATMVGLGLGPTVIALFTDYVFHDDNLIGSSILVVCTAAQLAAAILFAMGIKPFLRTKARLAE